MNKEHNYAECHYCKWQLEQQPDRDWAKYPCHKCNNTRSIIDPKEHLCNMCGECMCHEIKTLSGTWSTNDPYGLFEAKVTGGYESYHLLDLNRYTFSFCEKCLRQMFVQCKIKPIIEEVGFDNNVMRTETWEQDQAAYEYRLWQDNGGHHQAFLNKKCNTIKDCPNQAKYTVLYSDRDFSEQCCCEEHRNQGAWAVNARFVPFISDTLKAFI